MNINKFIAWLTGLIVFGMQGASLAALWLGDLSFDGYAAIWTPILTLVMGYWFRGTQAVMS